MRVQISLAGSTLPWRLLGGERADSWLAQCAWQADGGVCPLQIAGGTRSASDALEAVRDSFRSHSHGVGLWAQFEPITDVDGLYSVASRWLDMRFTNERDLVLALSDATRGTPTLFAVEVPGILVARTVEDGRRLVDLSSKIRACAPFTLIVVSSAAASGSESLAEGWPELHRRKLDLAQEWGSYVHERIAWHTGGRLEIVESLSGRVDQVSRGDDRALAQLIRDDSRERWDKLAPSVQQDVLSSTTNLIRYPDLQMPEGIGSQLSGIRPTPWLACALVLAQPRHSERLYLTAFATCRPLAMRLLWRCQEIEARVRDTIRPSPNATLPPEAVKTFQAYQNLSSFECRVAPPIFHPPTDAWDFATLGAVIQELSPLDHRKDSLHRLRRIRNVLAHGGSVGWSTIQEVNLIDEQLRRHSSRGA